jgi:hypothetical protein
LHARAQRLGQHLPAVPVVLCQPVLDGDNRVVAHEVFVEAHHLLAVERALFGAEDVVAAFVEFGRGDIERERDLLAGAVARAFNRPHQQIQRAAHAGHLGREAALVADGCAVALLVDDRLEVVIHLHAPAQRLRKRACAQRHNHKLLKVCAAFGVLAAVEHIHQRHGQRVRVHPAQVAIQR